MAATGKRNRKYAVLGMPTDYAALIGATSSIKVNTGDI